MKKLSLLIALFITASMVLVSCGGNADAPAAEAVVEEVPVEEAVVEEAVVEEAVVEEAVAANFENGKAVYDKMCTVCHATAVGGAAKLDDKARWEMTAAKGLETVNSNAINGYTGEFGVMLPKGGNATFTDEEVIDAVAYMLDAAGVAAE